jgi:transposase
LRSVSGEAQAGIRERAVRAVIDGMSHREGRVFGMERAAVSKWMRRWRDGGWERIKERRRRGGRPREQLALEPWRQGVIVRLIKEKNPDQPQLPGFRGPGIRCWS